MQSSTRSIPNHLRRKPAYPDALSAAACAEANGQGETRLSAVTRFLLLLCLLATQFVWMTGPAQADKADVDREKLTKLKSAYLYNLLKFTHWPEEKFADESEPILVLIVGQTPVAEVFTSAVNGRQAQDRSIQTEQLDYPLFSSRKDEKLSEDQLNAVRAQHKRLRDSHMVFIAEELKEHRRELLDVLNDSGTLIVSDMKRFANDGGMVGLALNDKKRLGFVVNLDTVEAGNLRLSSSLLKLAKVLQGSKSSTRPVTGMMLAAVSRPFERWVWHNDLRADS